MIDDDDINREDTRKRYIQFDTFMKWKHHLDKEFNAFMWLECEMVMECGKEDGEGTQV